MSVYKDKRTGTYYYDFQFKGRRFFGPTETANKREAEAVEDRVREEAKVEYRKSKQAPDAPLILDHAAGRYWTEVGQRHANAATTWTDLERLIAYFGKNKRLADITDNEVSQLVVWRSEQTIKGRVKDNDGKSVPLVSPATVNRSTIKPLRQLFTRAKRVWRVRFDQEPNWGAHLLPEPEERVRELHQHEGNALDLAVRDDYADWLEFARLTGLRRNETLIRWTAVNFETGQIRTMGKRKRFVVTPITPDVRAILLRCKGHHPEFVFTYICKRPKKGSTQVKGQRYPITPEGAKTQWRRLRARSKVQDFRFHDIRHDVATKLLRETGNLKLVQKALNHRNIKTTVKYAHVLDDEVAAALNRIAKSRKKSRKTVAKVS